jgi:predicted DNA-binding antitoxin AbrB/MazE fold protein
MDNLGYLIVSVISVVLILRLIGAWLLRINEVIYELRVIKDIKKLNLSEGQKRALATKYPTEFKESADTGTGDNLWKKT